MIRYFRDSPSRLALGYVALSVAALALFAVPLWSGWQTNLSTFRAYVQGEDTQRLVEAFEKDGAKGMVAAIEAKAGGLPAGEVIVLADPIKSRLAGNLPAWPAQVPDAPGTYGLVIDTGGGATMRVVASHLRLPGGYRLLVGRESVRFESLVERFWFGIAALLAVVLALGAGIGWMFRRALLAEQARGNDSLKRSEERYALAMAASDEGFWDWVVATDDFYVSPRLLDIYGFPPATTFAGREDFLARFPFHPDDRQKWRDRVAAHFAGTAARFDIEMRLLPRGELRWMHLTGLCTRDSKGAVLRWTGAVADITDRKRAEEALQLSEQRYALAMEAAGDGHTDWIIATDQFYASPRTLEICGLPPGTTFSGRAEWIERFPFHPEDRLAWERAVNAHLASGSGRFEMEIRILPGRELRWIKLSAMCSRDASGKAVRWSGAITDITERKFAEEALRLSEARYARAMQATEEGHFETKLDTDELFTSERLNEIYGFPPGTRSVNRSEYLKDFRFFSNDAEIYHAGILAAEAKGGPERYEFEYRILRSSGDVRWLRTRGKVTRDSEGRALRRTGMVADITDRKRDGEALRVSEDRYARAMAATDSGFWDWDVAADRYYVSPRLLELARLPPGTVVSNRAQLMAQLPLNADDMRAWQASVRGLFAGGGDRVSMDLRGALPVEADWFHLNGICVRDATGAVVRWTGSVTDISERKRAEAALRLSEERYARAMDASEEGHWDWNVVSDEIFVSGRVNEMFGYPADTRYATRTEFVAGAPYHPEDREYVIASVRAGLSGKSDRADFEYRIVPRPDVVRWLRARWKIARDGRGAPLRVIGVLTDITERRNANDALRRTEAYLSEALRLGRAGSFAFDVRREGYTHWSSEMYSIFGFDQSRGVPSVDALWERVHPEDVARVREVRPRAIREKTDYITQYRVVHPDGSIRHVHVVAHPAFDGAGNMLELVGIVTDVTERKQAEAALRESEGRFALAVAGSSDGIWDWDMQTGVMFLSERAQRIYGLEPGVTLRPRVEWREMVQIHPEDVGRQRRLVEEYLAGSQAEYDGEWRVRHADGSYRWIRLRGTCTRDASGRPTRFAGSVSDIDTRRRAEDALRLSEQRYALAMEEAAAGHTDWILATDQFYASPRALEIWGLPPETTFASRADCIKLVPFHADDRRAWVDAVRNHFARGVGRLEMEIRIYPKGEQRWVMFSGICSRDAAGTPARWVGSITDVTERKRAEAALRESEERFALAVAGTNEGIFDWNLATDRVYLSTRAQVMCGIEPRDPWHSREEWLSLLVQSSAEDLARLERTLLAYLKGEVPSYLAEFQVLRPDGERRWIRQRGVGQRDASGKVYRLTGSLEDITERKAAADALRESEARFRSLTELSSDWYWKQDENLRFTYLSSEANELAGYPADTSIGKTRWDLDRITPLSGSWAKHQAVLAARQPFREFEYCRLGEDGLNRYISISGAPMFDEQGRFMGYQGVGRNITDRKRIEAELRSRQEMLELAQKAARAVAFDWRIDAQEGENRWSPDLEAMYGLKPGSYDGSFKGWKKLIHPEDWPAVRDAVLRANETGDVAAEYRVAHPGGVIRWLQAKGKMLFDPAGKPVRLIGFMLDVTDRHDAESELRSLEKQLRQAQRLEAMGTLAGGIAHDFNNILGAILGYGEMALRDAPKGSRLRRDLDSIAVAGERGRALVDRILAFSRSGVVDKVAVHVEKVVRESIDLLSASLPSGISVKPELRAGRAAMLGDATQVHQLVMNLATNAVQAMPSGGTLRVSLDVIHLDTARIATTGTVAVGDYLVLKVADNGAGIAASILDRIFDPFFSTKEVGVGTGLGLSLVHGIVTEVGGAIDVATVQGNGSRFTVYLPRSGDAQEARDVETSDMPRGDGQRVLVVDDEEPLVRLASETLEGLGYLPVGFTSSKAALDAFRADPKSFDAVITDERMPKLSGTSLIREMRGIRRKIPILLVSGYVGANVADRAYNSGADEVLKKPLRARELATSLARVLQP